MSDTDEIAVTDCWNSRVQIFDSSGNYLRTVPTIVTAHMFCASRDTRVSYG